LSTEKFFTFQTLDLATFDANHGFGVNYTDIFTAAKVWKFGLLILDSIITNEVIILQLILQHLHLNLYAIKA
jgi:hypothetical protein